jgi:exopolyphosphatase/guanosine-5'-triphosphate,3'-diphosphate pyrophosphatase
VRVAAVDLGTNSTRLLVADVADGRVDEIARRLTITRLGEGVDGRGRLLPAAIERLHACLTRYHVEATALGAETALAIATSAVRDSENGRQLLEEIEVRYGFATRLLRGDEEAALTLRGVSSGRELPDGTLLVDIGGGSTELVLGGRGSVSFSTSLQLGCVRLTERYLASDPPTADELDRCAASVCGELPELEPTGAVGVAGTVTTIAALDLGLRAYDPVQIHGHRIPISSVQRELARLAALPVTERRRVPGLEPDRAPVIVGGAVILLEVLRAYDLHEIEASERDILHGAALCAAESADAALHKHAQKS